MNTMLLSKDEQDTFCNFLHFSKIHGYQGWDEILMITLISSKKLRNDSYCAALYVVLCQLGYEFSNFVSKIKIINLEIEIIRDPRQLQNSYFLCQLIPCF